MTIENLRDFFAWCSVINMGLLLFWWLLLRLARDFVYRIHGKWFKLSVEQFNSIHYKGMIFFELSIFLFNIVPCIALIIIS